MTLFFHDVEIDGRRTSVRTDGDRISAVGDHVRATGDDVVIDGGGGALIAGLHDHHIHLAAMAAADRSLALGGRDLDAAVRARHDELPIGAWLRVIGFDEGVHGRLDAARLDALAPDRPVRVQHRSGAMWVLSSVARHRLGATTDVLFRADELVRADDDRSEIDVAAVASRLARYGVTGVTDATPSTDLRSIELLADPSLAVRVTAMGGVALATAAFPPGIERGPVKLVIADHDLPSPDDVAAAITAARAAERTVAIHCVTRVALVIALAAFESAGSTSGDRIEHAAVVPPELVAPLSRLRLTVVTQPGFIAARGDRYLADVDAEDLPHLYPCASLLRAGIAVGGSTDAPFGPEDPWIAIAAAEHRQTPRGIVLGAEERLPRDRALALFLSPSSSPGGPVRQIVAGAPADLCLLGVPLVDALREPRSANVRLTVCRGVVTYAS